MIFRGRGTVYDKNGRYLEQESYVIVATRISKSPGVYGFNERKTFSDGRTFDVPFELHENIGEVRYEDEYKTISVTTFQKGMCAGQQSFNNFKQTLFCRFSDDKIESVFVQEDRIVYETLDAEK